MRLFLCLLRTCFGFGPRYEGRVQLPDNVIEMLMDTDSLCEVINFLTLFTTDFMKKKAAPNEHSGPAGSSGPSKP